MAQLYNVDSGLVNVTALVAEMETRAGCAMTVAQKELLRKLARAYERERAQVRS